MSARPASRRRRRHLAGVLRSARCGLRWGLVLALVGCGGSGEGGDESAEGACPNDLPDRNVCQDGAPSYAREIAPILEERCNACHYRGNPGSGVSLADHDAVFARRQTVQSRIYSCVMPPEAAPPLEPTERAALLEWLVCGAPDE